MAAQTDPGASRAKIFYFAAWRWHFYAGIFVAPFLIVLTTTGLIMLYASAFVDLNGERMQILPGETVMPASALAAAAATAVPGGIVAQYISPRSPGHVAVFRIDTGNVATAFQIDPYCRQVVGTSGWDQGWYQFAKNIHASLLLGDLGDRLIEIAAGFGIVLVVTRLYLWWPRGQGISAALIPRFSARGRALWKSLHQTLGFWLSAILLAFLISGMSWTGIWGAKFVQAWSTFPAEKWDNVPLSDDTHANMNHGAMKEVPWGLEQTKCPCPAPWPEKPRLKGR